MMFQLIFSLKQATLIFLKTLRDDGIAQSCANAVVRQHNMDLGPSVPHLSALKPG